MGALCDCYGLNQNRRKPGKTSVFVPVSTKAEGNLVGGECGLGVLCFYYILDSNITSVSNTFWIKTERDRVGGECGWGVFCFYYVLK